MKKINAYYVPSFDHYRADIIENGKEFEIIKPNGDDLVDEIKKLLGIDIEYLLMERVFIVPEQYSIV
jgi:hypothetical protein